MIDYTPFRLEPIVIRDQVAPARPGAYVLGHDCGGFVAGYVGRSDAGVRERLIGHNHRDEFDYFIFRYAADEEEAYRIECQLWHDFEGAALLNRYHPAAPPSSGLDCPYCKFAQGVSRSFGTRSNTRSKEM